MMHNSIWQLLSRTHLMSPARGWKWKWLNGVGKSEMDLFFRTPVWTALFHNGSYSGDPGSHGMGTFLGSWVYASQLLKRKLHESIWTHTISTYRSLWTTLKITGPLLGPHLCRLGPLFRIFGSPLDCGAVQWDRYFQLYWDPVVNLQNPIIYIN